MLAEVALVKKACAPTMAAAHVLLLRQIGTRLGLVVEDGANGVVVAAVVHGGVQYLVGLGEHGAEAEAGAQRVSGLEVRIAHRDIERIGIVAVADAVDEVGALALVGDMAVESGLILQFIGQIQRWHC